MIKADRIYFFLFNVFVWFYKHLLFTVLFSLPPFCETNADHHPLRHGCLQLLEHDAVCFSSTLVKGLRTGEDWGASLSCRALSGMHGSSSRSGRGDRESLRKNHRSGSFLCLNPYKNKLESDECENQVSFYILTKWWKWSVRGWHEALEFFSVKLFHAFL